MAEKQEAAETERKAEEAGGNGGAGHSYALTILAWTLTLSLIPMIIMAAQGYHCASQAVTESLIHDLRNVSEARATQVEDWVADQRRELTYLARAAGLPPECTAGCACKGMSDPVAKASQFLGTFLDSLEGYGGIAVVDAEGEVRESIGTFESPIGEIVAGSNGPVSENLRYVVVTPLFAEGPVAEGLDTREPAGSLVASLDLRPPLRQILSRTTGLGSSGRAVVATADGQVLGLEGERSFSRLSDALSEQVSLRQVGGGSFSSAGVGSTGDHLDVVAGFAPVEGLGISVVVERDRSDALHWLPRLARRAVLVGLLTALTVVLFSRFMSGRLSHPLRVLAGVARRISGGEAVARVPALSGREPSEVRTALNDMLDALQLSRQHLSQATALAAVGELSTSVVHELRNPLSSVKMNLQALAAKVAGDEVHEELADIATRQVGRIERMLNDLLSFGRPLSVEPKDATVAEILSSVADSVRAMAIEKEVAVNFENGFVPGSVRTDPERAAQALENLVRNAIEASVPGNTVRVVAFPAKGNPSIVTLEVIDEGPGLPGGSDDRLFRPFFTCKPGGTGLGLANVKKVTELLGGSVDAYNREEGGAVFRMTLPDLAPGTAVRPLAETMG